MDNMAYIGIDYGGYDGNTFAMCIIKEGRIVASIEKCNEQDFVKEARRIIKQFPNHSTLMEVHDKFKHKQNLLT